MIPLDCTNRISRVTGSGRRASQEQQSRSALEILAKYLKTDHTHEIFLAPTGCLSNAKRSAPSGDLQSLTVQDVTGNTCRNTYII